MNHLLTASQLTRPEVERLFAIADMGSTGYREPWIMASLFFEPSTRTRLSFEAAALRSGGQLLTVENGAISSSVTKGESIEDTIRTVSQYCDLIVMRHPELGAAERAAVVSDVPIINAGDGKGNHPTQALLDAYTIYKEKGCIDGQQVLIWGDLKHARTVNSLLQILKLFDVEVTAWELSDGDCVSSETIAEADIIYMTRPQVERFSCKITKCGPISTNSSLADEKRYYGLEKEMLTYMKQDAIIMHPLPRAAELPDEIASDSRAVMFRQAKYGVEIRKAILGEILNA